jgi:hypothetical protein
VPSVSKKQHNFMQAVAHNPSFAKKVGVPQSVGQEFSKADKGRTFKQGGNMKHEKHHEKKMAMGGMSPKAAALLGAMAARRRAPMAAPAAGMAPGMKHGGEAMDHHEHMKMAHHHLKMAMKAGGKTMEKGEPHSKDMGEKMLKHGGKAKHHYAKGGDVRMEPSHMEKSGDLRKGNKPHGEHVIQERGHTRAMMPKMKGNDIGTGPAMKRGGKAMKHGGKAC